MAVDFKFRKNAVRLITNSIGVYVLADLDNVPIYVGQSKDGIRARVARHLTSARSDIIANRQIDVWEIAYVWTFPVDDKSKIDSLEAALFHNLDPESQLMNGTLPRLPDFLLPMPKPHQVIQVMSDAEIADRKQPEQRLPRQASHYAQIVGHFIAVKNSNQVARAMNAHFKRLQKYHQLLLSRAEPTEESED